MSATDDTTILIGRRELSVSDVAELAAQGGRVRLDPDDAYRAKLRAGVDAVRRRVEAGDNLYGVTTGFGESCETDVPAELAESLQRNLVRYHGCGTGPVFDDRAVAAILVVRLASLAQGYSGVREVLLERLCDLINHRIWPQIPLHGSVGASGDLTPLSYVAAVLTGEREVSFEGARVDAREALASAGLEPIVLAPKEGLALMNGTSVMTGIGCLVWERSRRLARFAAALTAMAIDVMRCNRFHFDPRIGDAKPHPGQRQCAAWIRSDIEYDRRKDTLHHRLQDRYSIRCAPHVIGTLLDALTFSRGVLDIEINSANDNPLVDPDRGDFINGGNFYGGHVAWVLDGIKTAVANVASLVDRQLALLCDDRTSNGLPPNLVVPGRADGAAHHGFKAMQITASALAADALKLCMPASVFSRSTECHNQDIVSMGTHAARDCQDVLDRSETVAAVAALALAQAVDIRQREGCHARSRELHDAVRELVPVVDTDRRQDLDIERVLEAYRAGGLPVGGLE